MLSVVAILTGVFTKKHAGSLSLSPDTRNILLAGVRESRTNYLFQHLLPKAYREGGKLLAQGPWHPPEFTPGLLKPFILRLVCVTTVPFTA